MKTALIQVSMNRSVISWMFISVIKNYSKCYSGALLHVHYGPSGKKALQKCVCPISGGWKKEDRRRGWRCLSDVERFKGLTEIILIPQQADAVSYKQQLLQNNPAKRASLFFSNTR